MDTEMKDKTLFGVTRHTCCLCGKSVEENGTILPREPLFSLYLYITSYTILRLDDVSRLAPCFRPFKGKSLCDNCIILTETDYIKNLPREDLPLMINVELFEKENKEALRKRFQGVIPC